MSVITITINLPNVKANELDGLANRLIKMAEKVSVSGKPPSRKTGTKKKVNEMSPREFKKHLESKIK